MNWAHVYYTFLIWGGWIGAIVFPIIYALTARFWNTQLGRHFWAYSTVIALLYTSSIIKNYFPDFKYDTHTRYVLLTLAVIVVWWRLYEYARITIVEQKMRKRAIERIKTGEDPTVVEADFRHEHAKFHKSI